MIEHNQILEMIMQYYKIVQSEGQSYTQNIGAGTIVGRILCLMLFKRHLESISIMAYKQIDFQGWTSLAVPNRSVKISELKYTLVDTML